VGSNIVAMTLQLPELPSLILSLDQLAQVRQELKPTSMSSQKNLLIMMEER